MDNNTKNMLVLGGAAVAGGWGGSWAAARLGATMGLSLGPWGSAAGAVIGSMLGTTIARMVLETQMMPGLEASITTDAVAEPTGDT